MEKNKEKEIIENLPFQDKDIQKTINSEKEKEKEKSLNNHNHNYTYNSKSDTYSDSDLDSDSDSDSNTNFNSEEKELNKKFNQIGKVPLGFKKKEIFKEMLRTLNNFKSSFKVLLFFCYENIKNAEMIVSMIFEAFKNSQNFNKKVKELIIK